MSETIDILMELLNEYQESECAIAEDRVTYYADRIDGRTEDEQMDERTRTEHNGAGLSITDELRDYVGSFYLFRYKDVRDRLDAIANRIDERYSVKVERLEKYRAAVDAMLKEYIKLPVDADGLPIRVGDVMEERSGHTFEVASLMAFGGSDNWLVLSDARNFSSFREPHDLRHVQPDTWERIITDAMTEAQEHYGDDDLMAELVERCKKLAGEAQ